MAPSPPKKLGTIVGFDGQPMTSYAQRVPKIRRRSSAGSAVDQGALDPEQLAQIIDKLYKHPNLIPGVHQLVFSSNFAIQENNDDQGAWEEGISTLAKLPDKWIANWLLKRNEMHGLKATQLQAFVKRIRDCSWICSCSKFSCRPR